MPFYSVSFGNALKYVYLMAIGELGADNYEYTKGNHSENILLGILFVMASFLLIILLLNLLIGLMGEPFARTDAVAEADTYQEQLKFVMEHWEMGEEYSRVKYLITAFMNEEDEENVEML